MDIVLGSIAALIGVGFTLELLLKSFRSKKPYIISWTVAVFMYTVATIALVSGLINGWNYINFGIFYFFGGITNVPAFGIGSAYLIFDDNKVNVISGLYVLFVLGPCFLFLQVVFLIFLIFRAFLREANCMKLVVPECGQY